MKMNQKGQVTIPQDLRKRFGMTRDTEIVFEAVPEGLLLRTENKGRAGRLRRGIAKARGCADAELTTEAVMELTRG